MNIKDFQRLITRHKGTVVQPLDAGKKVWSVTAQNGVSGKIDSTLNRPGVLHALRVLNTQKNAQ